MTTLYSSVFGGFEHPWAPIRQPKSVRTILVSDSQSRNRNWPAHSVPTQDFRSPRLANRFHKMLFHRSLPSTGISVYVDANVRPIESLVPLFEAFSESGADVGLYRHYARASVHEEARACLHRNKIDNPAALTEELKLYDSAGFPATGGMWNGGSSTQDLKRVTSSVCPSSFGNTGCQFSISTTTNLGVSTTS